MNTYLYCGSFDPFTTGHAAVIKKLLSSSDFAKDKLIICIGKNEKKTPFFTIEEKMEIIRLSLADYENQDISIIAEDGLTVDIAFKHKANILIRGIRANTEDIAREQELANTNRNLALVRGFTLETKLITCNGEMAHVSSTIVRELLKKGEYITAFLYLKKNTHALIAEKMLKDVYTKPNIVVYRDIVNTQFDFNKIAEAYRPRAYHNLAHIAYMLNMLEVYITHALPEEISLINQHKDDLITAIFMHDFVQDSGEHNEVKSAQELDKLKKYSCFPYERDIRAIAQTAQLIMATKHDVVTELNGLEALIADLDLAILGTRFPTLWNNYITGIREEYKDIPQEVYKKERIKVLKNFLNRPYIYHTAFFRQTLETCARFNIQTEITALEKL